MEICLVGGELSHADRRTDRHDEAKSHFAILRKCLKRCLVMANGRLFAYIQSQDNVKPQFSTRLLLRPSTGRTQFPVYSHFKLKLTGFNLYKMQSFYG